jgi:predicted Zn-dependent protease
MLVYLLGCNHRTSFTLTGSTEGQAIAFQPLDDFQREDVQVLSNKISATFNRKVIILKPITISVTYLHPVIEMYSADSNVKQLSCLSNDTIVEIIGLTHKPLYTIKDDPKMPYYDEGILGFAHQPGNACVVSDNNSKVTKTLTVERLQNNILPK